jgi:recombination protein RecT
LIPFYNNKTKQKEAQLMIGYRGMLDLARRSGQVLSVNVYEIYSTDEVEVTFGTNPNITHKRDIKTGGTGEIIGVYAVAKLKDGGCQFEVMTKAQVDEIMNKSLEKIDRDFRKYSPWINHYNEMAKKTAIRRLFKYLPVSIEIQRSILLDEQAEAGIPQSNKSLSFPDAIDIGDSPETQITSEDIDPNIVDKAKEMFS